MILIESIKYGLLQGLKYRRVASYILAIQLFLSSLIGILAYDYIIGSIGQSTNLSKIIDGYNHDVFQDLLRFESTGWIMIKKFTILIIFLYLIIGPIIMGGLLNAYNKEKDNWQCFWKGGSKYYLSFLKLNIIVLIIVVVFTAIIGFTIITSLNPILDSYLTEIPALFFLAFMTFLTLLFIILMVSISTKAKWEIITQSKSIWRAFKSSFIVVFKRFYYYLALGVLFLLISVIFAIVTNLVINRITEHGFLLVLLALIIQIFAIYIRVCLRNGYYASILNK